eukprot:7143914-Ditylum_brightwellii.AAC.1
MHEVRDAWHEVELRKHTKTRFQWKKKDFDNIDWDKSSKEFRKGDYYHKCFITSENKEQWMSLPEVLTHIYDKNKVDPVLR